MLRANGLESDFFPRNRVRAVAPEMCSDHDFID
jgi:hypothetical protein